MKKTILDRKLQKFYIHNHKLIETQEKAVVDLVQDLQIHTVNNMYKKLNKTMNNYQKNIKHKVKN